MPGSLTGLRFEQAIPAPSTVPNRADVACFIGFVRRSQNYRERLPEALVQFLRGQGLVDAAGAPRADAQRVLELSQLPVPIDSWSTFTNLFEPRSRPASAGAGDDLALSYLGAAVRSFFAQGGRKCFVIRAGDPLALDAPRAQRLALVGALIPPFGGDAAAAAPDDPAAWQGIAHVLGLNEVSFVCLPDLPWLVAHDPPAPADEPPPAARREFFVECSDAELVTPLPRVSLEAAPRLDDAEAYTLWSMAVRAAALFLADGRPARARKDVQLIAAVPLPQTGSDADRDLLSALLAAGVLERASSSITGLSSAHVQLAYPWLGWPGSAELPEGLEPPDGALAGVLARGTLRQGAFTSFGDEPLRHVNRIEPQLSAAQSTRARPRNLASNEAASESRFLSLRQRVSLFGFTPDGPALLSDVTTSADDSFRPASVNRLMSVWVRALARAGEDFAFEPSGELTWAGIRYRLQFIGEALFRSGALGGKSPREAFAVRCDSSTMTRADLDGGRLIAEVQFRPAIPIEGITIALALDESQRISIRQVA